MNSLETKATKKYADQKFQEVNESIAQINQQLSETDSSSSAIKHVEDLPIESDDYLNFLFFLTRIRSKNQAIEKGKHYRLLKAGNTFFWECVDTETFYDTDKDILHKYVMDSWVTTDNQLAVSYTSIGITGYTPFIQLFINGNPVAGYTTEFDNDNEMIKFTFDQEYTAEQTSELELSIVYTEKEMVDISMLLPLLTSETQDISNSGWQFSSDGSTFNPVTLPHTINRNEMVFNVLTRGNFTYKLSLNLVKNRKYTLVIGAADQSSIVKVNGVEVKTTNYGYTAICADLGTVNTGENIIEVITSNIKRPEIQPYAADFNPNNGITRKVYLYTSGRISFNTTGFGSQKAHVVASTTTNQINVTANLLNQFNESSIVDVICEVRKADTLVASQTTTITLPENGNADLDINVPITDPELWDGRNSVALYEVTLKASVNDVVQDSTVINTGFRSFQVIKQLIGSTDRSFKLNGNDYHLYGVNYHTDIEGNHSALSDEEYEEDWTLMESLKCTHIKMGHYPCDHLLLDKCDAAGVIVTLQIPFCRNFPASDATNVDVTSFRQNIIDSMQAMVCEYYNHPCIVFWDMCNEVGMDAVLGYSDEEFHTFIKNLADTTKIQDPNRLVGYSMNAGIYGNPNYTQKTWADVGDFISTSMYSGWYGGSIGQAISTLSSMNNTLVKPLVNNEHGYGASIDRHCSWDYAASESADLKGTNGQHYEEYQAYCFEQFLKQAKAQNFLVSELIWAMFDFAVYVRNEGSTICVNDKGLITRDRSVCKDAYFLHKAYWNPAPLVHITSKRWLNRTGVEYLSEHVYSNCTSLKVYFNNELIDTLTEPDVDLGVIWNTSTVTLVEGENIIRVDGLDDSNNVVATDSHIYSYQQSVVVPVTNFIDLSWEIYTTENTKTANGVTSVMGTDGYVTLNGTANADVVELPFFVKTSGEKTINGWDDPEPGTYTTAMEDISGDCGAASVSMKPYRRVVTGGNGVDVTYSLALIDGLEATPTTPAQLQTECLHVSNGATILHNARNVTFTNFRYKPHIWKECANTYDGGAIEEALIPKDKMHILDQLPSLIWRSHCGIINAYIDSSLSMFYKLTHNNGDTFLCGPSNYNVADTTHTLVPAGRTARITIRVFECITPRTSGDSSLYEIKCGMRTKASNANVAAAEFSFFDREIGQAYTFDVTATEDLSVLYMFTKNPARLFLSFSYSLELLDL